MLVKVYTRRLDHKRHDHNVMAVYDPSHLSHFVKSQPMYDQTDKVSNQRKESNFVSGLGRILKEDQSPIQTIFDNLKLSKTVNRPNWLKYYQNFPEKTSKKYSNDQSPISSMEQEDQINRRFVTL